jgi:hypothetical protein
MPRNIEKSDFGGRPDKRLGNPRLARGGVHRRQVDHRDLAEINGARRRIGRRAGHRWRPGVLIVVVLVGGVVGGLTVVWLVV